MRAEIKFPLLAAFDVNLPDSAIIHGLKIREDITFLDVEFPGRDTLPKVPEKDWRQRHLLVFLEGERKVIERPSKENGGKTVFGPVIPIPEEAPGLRKIGILTTIRNRGTWHVFERKNS